MGAAGDGPTKGWTRNCWKGWVPFEEMPHVFNPPVGYIITANNCVVDREYKHFLSAEWAPRFRYERIAELIQAKKKFDVGSMARIQMDTTSLLAKLICESITPALSDLQVGKYREAVDQLRNWDYNNTVESVPATIYHEFLLKFAKNTFADEMGEELGRYLDNYYLWNKLSGLSRKVPPGLTTFARKSGPATT
jgi:penicillin amidase